MDHWIRYKGVAVNLSKCGVLRPRKINKEVERYSDVGVKKGHQWIVEADYHALESFSTKEGAIDFIDVVLSGKYDVGSKKDETES